MLTAERDGLLRKVAEAERASHALSQLAGDREEGAPLDSPPGFVEGHHLEEDLDRDCDDAHFKEKAVVDCRHPNDCK